MRNASMLHTFVRFGLVGGLATALHYGLYCLFCMYMGPNWAFSLAYLLSFVANFLLTSYFTFGTMPTWGKLVGHAGAHVLNYLLQLALLNLFLWLGIPEMIAPLPVFAVSVPVNFLVVRFVFTNKKV